MASIEDIKLMRQEGMSESQILEYLKSKGIPSNEASDLISSAKIKEAVSGRQTDPQYTVQEEDMQKSIYSSEDSDEQNKPEYAEQTQPQYENYQQYSPSINIETISEIAEQAVIEKISIVKNKMEKLAESQNLLESNLLNIDERLKRMEKIIDRLQLSILQKVGESITNIEDLKNEMMETQKTFKSLISNPQRKAKTSENLDTP